MEAVVLALLIVAAVLFSIVAFGQRSLLAGGLLAWVLAELVPALAAL
jgi:hypothetical protein